MDGRWYEFGKFVERECCLVRNNRLGSIVAPTAPKPETHKVVVIGERQRWDAVKTVAGPLKVARNNVVAEMRRGIPGSLGLASREIASLRYSDVCQPTQSNFGITIWHGINLQMF